MGKDTVPRTARRIPDASIRRLPAYLRALEAEAGQRLTSAALGELTGFSSEQVRKDLAYFGAFGTRGVGYPAQDLASEIRHILGLDRELKAALFGAGHLGTALARYVAATHRDVRIVAIFDPDPEKTGSEIAGTAVTSLVDLEGEVERLRVAVAILAVPEAAAEPLARRLAAAGVRGFLNFAPVMLSLPPAADDGPPVTIHNIDLSIELQTLAYFVQVHETARV
ncbi:MAG: redox-sensing transcriptional repressor Rex [Thermaerobacter sp.]|nr:redox-sensing transcriptional repressor Rex [Thermaerobacter sp.]